MTIMNEAELEFEIWFLRTFKRSSDPTDPQNIGKTSFMKSAWMAAWEQARNNMTISNSDCDRRW